MNDTQEILVLQKLADILDQFNIGYAIGGSMASSVYGIVRFTQDADITVHPFSSVADKLYERLKVDFYISRDAMQQALDRFTSFNIVHFETAFKIDVFIRQDTEFDKQLLQRSRQVKLSDAIEKEFNFLSPEDVVLIKLRWFKQAGCTSDTQWSDVLGVLGVQSGSLDFEYLKTWSKKLQLSDLLQKAITESKA